MSTISRIDSYAEVFDPIPSIQIQEEPVTNAQISEETARHRESVLSTVQKICSSSAQYLFSCSKVALASSVAAFVYRTGALGKRENIDECSSSWSFLSLSTAATLITVSSAVVLGCAGTISKLFVRQDSAEEKIPSLTTMSEEKRIRRRSGTELPVVKIPLYVIGDSE